MTLTGMAEYSRRLRALLERIRETEPALSSASYELLALDLDEAADVARTLAETFKEIEKAGY